MKQWSYNSYKNRVELQNGCLVFVYVNLFIFFILNGFCLSSGGVVDKKLVCDNLNLVIDVYILRVDKVLCVGIEIYFF